MRGLRILFILSILFSFKLTYEALSDNTFSSCPNSEDAIAEMAINMHRVVINIRFFIPIILFAAKLIIIHDESDNYLNVVQHIFYLAETSKIKDLYQYLPTT